MTSDEQTGVAVTLGTGMVSVAGLTFQSASLGLSHAPIAAETLAAAAAELQTGGLTVFDDVLSSLYLQYTGSSLAAAFAAQVSLPASAILNLGGRAYVVVDIIARDGDGSALLDHILASGVDLVAGSAYRGMTGGLVAIDQLDLLRLALGGEAGAVDDLGAARVAVAQTSVGSVTTQADAAQYNDEARASFSVDGTGIRVGVLSDSLNKTGSAVDNLTTNIASNDLPVNTFLLQDELVVRTDEGRAMAQLIHDLAPGASIDFATAFLGQASFANNIRGLAARGAQIIVDDVFYFDELAFQDGVIAQAVNEVVAGGVTYFASAGNSGTNGWDGFWTPGATQTIGANTYTLMRFGTGLDYLPLTLSSSTSSTYAVWWDSPSASAGGTANPIEIDMFLTDTSGAVLLQTTANNIGADAVALISATGGSVGLGLRLVVGLRNGSAAPTEVRVVTRGANVGAADGNQNNSTFFTHAAADGAIAVSAAGYSQTPEFGVTPPVHESFTTRGPDRHWYDTAGNRLSAVSIREIPITAVDGGNTTFFSQDDGDADTFPNFYGTSAAAPDAAAVAALMLQANSGLTPLDIRRLLQDSALDMNDTFTPGFDTGYDSRTGAGLINAKLAVGFATTLEISNPSQTLLHGTHFADKITGDAAGDKLLGYEGADTLIGGAGSDNLTGGTGVDTFRGTATDLNGDTIVDYAYGEKIFVEGNLAGIANVKLVDAGADTEVQIDADNNGSFETVITLTGDKSGAVSLTSSGGFTNNVITINAVAATTLDISPEDISEDEGDSGTTAYTYTVTRTGDTSQAGTVNWAVAGGAGVTASDFVGGVIPTGVVNFTAGQVTANIVVNVQGDIAFEGDETFTVTLSSPTGDTVIGVGSATGEIVNDDTPPSLSISPADISHDEGDSGTTTYTYTVTRTGDTTQAGTVNWAVTGTGGATASDFVGAALPSGVVNFTAGQTSASIVVNVQGDVALEADESFTVTLSAPSGGATIDVGTATGEIANDDTAPTLNITPTSLTKNEGTSGATAYTYTITRTGDTSVVTTVDWAVTGAGGSQATATDFVGSALPTGTATFAIGATTATVVVNVQGDTVFEPTEGFKVTLSNPSGAAVIDTGEATGTITNDDTAPTVTLVTTSVSKFEGASGTTAFEYALQRTGDLSVVSTVNWAVTGVGGSQATATDFVGGALPSGVATFAVGASSAVITVNVQGDTTIEPNETFQLTLSGPSGDTVLSGGTTASGTIRDDDGDTTPPTLSWTLPADDATSVAVGANLVLNFSENIQAGTGSFDIYVDIGGNAGAVLWRSINVSDSSQVSISGRTVTLNPSVNLDPNQSYFVRISAGAVQDAVGNPYAGLTSNTAFNFSTAAGQDSTAPTLVFTSPVDNSTGVAVDANLVILFNERIQAGTGAIEIRRVSDSALVQSVNVTDASQISFSGGLVTINPTADLQFGTAYYVTAAAGVFKDLNNNAFAGITSPTAFNFTTVAGVDTAPPTLSSSSPADDATNVPIGANISLTFNEAVKAGAGAIEIRRVADGSLAQSITVTDTSQVSFSGSTAVINPASDLAPNVAYYVNLAGGVITDLSNNPFAGITTATALNFTTSAADTTAPLLISTTPADNATNVSPSANLVFNFNEAVQAGSGAIQIYQFIGGNGGGVLFRSISVTDTSQVSFSGSTMTVNPSVNLVTGDSYFVLMASGVVRDTAGNPYGGLSSITQYDFTVGTGPSPTTSASAPVSDGGSEPTAFWVPPIGVASDDGPQWWAAPI